MVVLLCAFALFGVLAIKVSSGWAVGILVAIALYALWNAVFACPVCGTPYLYVLRGMFVVPTSFPKKCSKCGHPTNQG